MGNTTDEKRWGFRAAVLAGTILPLLYVISIGPACRFCFDHHRSPEPLPVIYWPIWQLSRFSVTGRATAFYLSLWVRAGEPNTGIASTAWLSADAQPKLFRTREPVARRGVLLHQPKTATSEEGTAELKTVQRWHAALGDKPNAEKTRHA